MEKKRKELDVIPISAKKQKLGFEKPVLMTYEEFKAKVLTMSPKMQERVQCIKEERVWTPLTYELACGVSIKNHVTTPREFKTVPEIKKLNLESGDYGDDIVCVNDKERLTALSQAKMKEAIDFCGLAHTVGIASCLPGVNDVIIHAFTDKLPPYFSRGTCSINIHVVPTTVETLIRMIHGPDVDMNEFTILSKVVDKNYSKKPKSNIMCKEVNLLNNVALEEILEP